MTSQIIVTNDINEECKKVESALYPTRVVTFLRDDFKLEDAKAVVAEAYISEESRKYILFGAKKFLIEAQNSLLKILEEPPSNIVFIILTTSKSALLPTILSRLALTHREDKKEYISFDIQIAKLDIAQLFSFVKEYESLKSHDAKDLLQSLMYHIVHKERLVLQSEQLEAFDKAFRLVSLNARFQTILVMVLMTFIRSKR